VSTPPVVPYSANPTEPQLVDILELWKKDVFLNLNSTHIATVQSFNSAQQTATATINYKQTYFQPAANGQYSPVLVDYPVLVDCPVVSIGGAAGVVTGGDPTGEECLVLFNDRDINNWFAGLATGAVATSRLHSFSDGLILVGVRSLARVLENFDSVRVALRSRAGETVVAVNPVSSKVLITNDYPALTTTLNTLLANLITHIQNLVAATAAITVTVSAAPGTSSTPVNAGTITAVAGLLTADAAAIAALLE
jgi:hypothetical protein